MTIRAVIFDLGGVVFPSPFDAFDDYDRANNLPTGTVRALIRRSSGEGAWAALERGDVTMDEFADALEAEADAAGFRLDARQLMGSFGSSLGPRPEMVRAIRRIRKHSLTAAALTNNWSDRSDRSTPTALDDLGLFDVIIESSVEGLRKPDPRIYALALSRLDVHATEAAFLDDLGINLKPAREMGMTTIKVADPTVAIVELAAAVGFDLE